MDVKIGEQPKIEFKLQPAAPVNIHLEAKYIRGGDFVESSQIKRIEAMTEEEYKHKREVGAIRDDILYILYNEE